MNFELVQVSKMTSLNISRYDEVRSIKFEHQINTEKSSIGYSASGGNYRGAAVAKFKQ